MSLDKTKNGNDYALARKPPSAVEKTQPGPKRILSSMIAEALGLIKSRAYHDGGHTISQEFEIKWRFGARTAALIVKLANRFASRIEISRGEEVADATSIMRVMMLSSIDGADAGCGCRFKVSATGPDAVMAMNALTELFTCGSRMDSCIEPSCPLKPALAGYTHDTISYGCKSGHAWDVHKSDES